MVKQSVEVMLEKLPKGIREMDVEEFMDKCKISDDFDYEYNIELKCVDQFNLLGLDKALTSAK